MEVIAPLNSPFYTNSLIIKNFKDSVIFAPRHQHNELEIVYIYGAAGSLKSGDNELVFTGAGQLFFFGPYIPHRWLLHKYSSVAMNIYVIHFNMQMFGEFICLPEFSKIGDLFASLNRGISIEGMALDNIERDIFKMYKSSPADRIIILLKILHSISCLESYSYILGQNYNIMCNKKDGNNLRKIYRYVNDNYDKEITIEDMSNLLKMTRESFCRYFKQKTGITFLEYLIETRIGIACRMLLTKDISVNETAEKCGYRNMSNFFQQFRGLTGLSPLTYQRHFKE